MNEEIVLKAENSYSLTLSGAEISAITFLLEQLPYKEANPTISSIVSQIKNQIQ